MTLELNMFTLVVDDYDRAIAYYCDILGFHLIEDTPLSPDKRWVVIAPSPETGARILLAKAKNDAETSAIGAQTGGRVAFFLNSTCFKQDYEALMKKGVIFLGAPRTESYGQVVVFKDIYGNKWDLIGP